MEELKRYAFVFGIFPWGNFFCIIKKDVLFIIWIVIYMEEIT